LPSYGSAALPYENESVPEPRDNIRPAILP